MKIESIDLHQVSLPLVSPFTTSFGTQTERHSIIVTIQAEGLTGYGECVADADPGYSYETTGTAWHILSEFLIPTLIGHDLDDPDAVWDLFRAVRGHNMAKAALEMTCWDLVAKARHLSLAALFGSARDRVSVGVSVGIQRSPEALVETVGRYLSDGYRRIKIKIAPGRERSETAAVRAAFPDILLQIDANSAYTLDDAATLRELDDYNLLLIEQPLSADDIIDHAVLQRQLQTPICLDESIHSPVDARHALELGSCRVINIKPGRVGGHRQSRAIHDLCHARAIPVWCGGMLETNIGRAHNVALATLPGFTLPSDISASARYYRHDIAGPDFVLNEDSTLTVPDGPGVGVVPDPSALAAAERHARFSTSR